MSGLTSQTQSSSRFAVITENENLEMFERFLGFYEIHSIRSETIVTAIKGALIRMQQPLLSCRGQTYKGASNMLGKKPGVAAKILNEVLKALPTHWHAHSLSLFPSRAPAKT